MNQLIEIHGDVWLTSEIIMIGLNEPESKDDLWEVAVRIRGSNDEFAYSFDSEKEAKSKHIELVKEWKQSLGQHSK